MDAVTENLPNAETAVQTQPNVVQTQPNVVQTQPNVVQTQPKKDKRNLIIGAGALIVILIAVFVISSGLQHGVAATTTAKTTTVAAITTITSTALQGACKVVRTNATVSLVGECNSHLPQYVANFNGQSGYIDLGSDKFDYPSVTVCAWFKTPFSGGDHRIVTAGSENSNKWLLTISNGGHVIMSNTASSHATAQSNSNLNDGSWHYACGTSDPENIYISGVLQSSTRTDSWSFESDAKIGARGGDYYFNGTIADVQIYNTSLSQNEIKALYLEGIGGVPVTLSKLVGWWPLNGDTNDYTGNNNGVPNSINYTTQWLTGYTAP